MQEISLGREACRPSASVAPTAVVTFGARRGTGQAGQGAWSAQVWAQQVRQGVGGGGGSNLHLVPGCPASKAARG